MRLLCFLLLALVVAAVCVFAVQNNETVTLQFLDRSLVFALPLLIGAVYLLGMVSGWTVFGLLRGSLWRATERR